MATFEGTTLRLGDKDYVVPALSIKSIRKLNTDIQHLITLKGSVNINDEQIDSILNVIHAAMSRNYPEITRDDLEEKLDMKNIQDVIPIILGHSGIVEKKNQAKIQNP